MAEHEGYSPERKEPVVGLPQNGEAPPEQKAGRSVLRLIIRSIGILVVALLVLIGLLLVAIQTNWGAGRFGDFIVGLVNPIDDAVTEYDAISGTFITGVEWQNLRMYRVTESDTVLLARVDTLRLRYNLLSLLWGKVHVREILLSEPYLVARQQSDGSWDLLEPFLADTTVADTLEKTRAFDFQVDEVRITGAALNAWYWPLEADSLLRVRDLNLQARNIFIGESQIVPLDSLSGRFNLSSEPGWISLRLGGALLADRVAVRYLSLTSPRSDVAASGVISLGRREGATDEGDMDFTLAASPLALDDIRPFVPALKAGVNLNLDLQLGGTADLIQLNGDADVTGAGGFSVQGVVSPGDRQVVYDLEGQFRAFDPGALVGLDQATRLNGTFDVDLKGLTTKQLSGSAVLRLDESGYGEYLISHATLESTWEDGLARIDLDAAMRGAALALDGIIRPFDERPNYRFNGRLSELDIGRFVVGQSSDIAATLTVQGNGFDPKTAEIEGDLSMARSAINRTSVQDGRIRFELVNGNLDTGVRLLFPEGEVFASAEVEFTDPMRYSLSRGRFTNVDLAAILGDTASSSLNGTFSLRGEGADLAMMDAQSEFHLFDSYYGAHNIAAVNAVAVVNDGALRLEAYADLIEAGSANLTVVGRPFDDTPTLQFREGRFTDVDLGRILENPNLQTDLTGTIELALRGFDPETMSLQGRLGVEQSQFNEQAINSANLLADLRSGALNFDANVTVPDGQAQLAGFARPFLDTPVYEVREGSFSGINLAAFTANPSLRSNLNGTLTLEGRGIEPQHATVSGRFNLVRSVINDQTIEAASIGGDMVGGVLDFSARMDMPEGGIELAGGADFNSDTPTYAVSRGIFQRVDVGALTGNPNLETNLNGRLSLTGRGFDPDSMALNGTIELSPSRINDQQITSASVRGEILGGRLDFDASFDLPEGQAQLAGQADFRGEELAYLVRSGTLEGLDLGAFTGNPKLSTDLNGSFSLSGRGVEPETMNLQAQFDLAGSQINQQAVSSASVSGELSSGHLNFSATLETPDGLSRLSGTAQPFLEVPVYALEEGSFSGLNVGALIGNPGWETNLNGTVTLAGQGFEPDVMVLDGRFEFARSRINQATLLDGTLAGRIDSGRVNVDADLDFAEGLAQVNFQGQPFLETPTYTLNGRVFNIDLEELTGSDTLQAYITANFEIEGVGIEPETMILSGRIDADTVRFENAGVRSLYADFHLINGFLQLDSLLFQSNFADLNGRGGIALFDSLKSSDFRFDADVRTIDPLIPYLPVKAMEVEDALLAGRVYGTPDRLRFTFTGEADRLVYQSYMVSNFQGSLVGALGPNRSVQAAEVRGEASYVGLPQLSLQESNVQASLENDILQITAEFDVDENRAVQLRGHLDMRPEVQQAVLEDLRIRFANEEWELLQRATLSYGDQYRVSNFLFYSGNQQIAIDGIVDPYGMQNLVLTIENVRVGNFTDLFGFDELDGVLDGSLDLTGPAYAPVIQGSLLFDVITQNSPVGDLNVDVRYDSLRLNLNATLNHVDGSTLTANGYVPLNLAFAPDTAAVGVQLATSRPGEDSGVDFQVAADSFAIDWISPFLDPEIIRDISGYLTADIDITGTLDAPVLEGTARLSGGSIYLTEQDVAYSEITANAVLAENVIQIRNAILHSGGTATAEGTITLPELTLGEFDIRANLDEFLAVDSDQYRMVVGGEVHLQGTTDSPIVTGDVTVRRGDIFLSEATSAAEVELVSLTERDIRILEERFGYEATRRDTSTFSFYENMTLDMAVTIERNTWIRQTRNPEMAIEFTGQIELQKDPFEEIEMFGTVEVVPLRSQINQFGRRFSITQGELSLNGPIENVVMNLGAEYRVRARRSNEPEVIITLAVTGNMTEPKLELGSDPAMEYTDIVSYIATGRPAGETLHLSGEDVLSGGAGIAVSQLTGAIEGIASEGLGLDVVEIQHDGLRGAVLVAGKYVYRDLFAAITYPVAFTSTENVGGRNINTAEFLLEYEVIDWLLLRTQGGNQSLQFNLLWEYAY